MAGNQAFRWLLTRIRSLKLTSPLARRCAANLDPAPRTSPVLPSDIADLTPEKAVEVVNGLAPDAAWVFYRELPEAIKEHVANHCSTEQWAKLFVREVQAQALACAKPEPQLQIPRRVTAPYFEFKRMQIKCPKCAWQGLGADCDVGEMYERGEITDYVCPKCAEDVAFAPWPTLEEYYANWGTLTELERAYVFRIEQARETAEGRESSTQ